jgi:hypothetical protein
MPISFIVFQLSVLGDVQFQSNIILNSKEEPFTKVDESLRTANLT